MRELEFPFDPNEILKRKKQLRRRLLENGETRIKKRIAILGGSTTHDIMLVLELFLLNDGIEPEFYECEYGKYWEDVMFDNPELRAFGPELVYIHTSLRNIPETAFPVLYTALVRQNILSIERLAALMCAAPRARFGIPPDEGDYTVFDIFRPYAVRPAEFASKGRSSPFTGRLVWGRCVLTVHRGRVVYAANDARL